MNKTLALLTLILLAPTIVLAGLETVEVSVTLQTYNRSVKAAIEGGNEYHLSCNQTQSITQKLQVKKDIACQGGVESCERQFDNLTRSFISFSKIFNRTQCETVREDYAKCGARLTEVEKLLDDCTGGNLTETYWQDKYDECNINLKTELTKPNYQDLNRKCEESLDACEEREKAQRQREFWAFLIGGVVGGGAIYIFLFKRNKFISPVDNLRRR